jgi:hypothetical protein
MGRFRPIPLRAYPLGVPHEERDPSLACCHRSGACRGFRTVVDKHSRRHLSRPGGGVVGHGVTSQFSRSWMNAADETDCRKLRKRIANRQPSSLYCHPTIRLRRLPELAAWVDIAIHPLPLKSPSIREHGSSDRRDRSDCTNSKIFTRKARSACETVPTLPDVNVKMNTLSIVILALALGAVASTAGATSQAIAYKPRLVVSSNGPANRSETRFATYAGPNSWATAEVDLYIASSYKPTLGQVPGTKIGSVSGGALDRGLTAPFTSGIVTVADPATYANNSCDSAAHSAIWLATLTSSTTTFKFPIFVRTLAHQSTELHWCFARTDPNLAWIAFDLLGVFRAPPSGSALWDARFSPLDPQTGAELAGDHVSSLVTVKLPQIIRLSLIYSRRTHVYRLTGSTTENGTGARGSTRLYRSIGDGPFVTTAAIGGTPRLSRTGRFLYSGRLTTKKRVRFRVHFAANPLISQRCGKDVNGVPCVNAATSDWEKDSGVASLTP